VRHLYWEALDTDHALVEFRQGGYGVVSRYEPDSHDGADNLLNDELATRDCAYDAWYCEEDF